MSTPIVEVVDLTAHLSGDKQAAIDAATDAVREYCGWHVTPVIQDDELQVRGNGSTVLQLRSLRVASVASVTDEAGAPVTGWKVAPEGYLYGRAWSDGHVYTVTLTHGYAEAPALAQVILRAAARAISSPDGQVPTSVSLGSARVGLGGVVSAAGAFPQSDMAILDRYRLPPLP